MTFKNEQKSLSIKRKMSIDIISFDNLVQILESGLGVQGKSLGQVLEILEKVEDIYYAMVSKDKKIPAFVNDKVLKIITSYLGFIPMKRYRSSLSTLRLWGILQMNYTSFERRQYPWGYYLIEVSEEGEDQDIAIKDLSGNVIMEITCVLFKIQGYYLMVLENYEEQFKIHIYHCDPKTAIIKTIERIKNMYVSDYMNIFENNRINVHLTSSGLNISIASTFNSYVYTYDKEGKGELVSSAVYELRVGNHGGIGYDSYYEDGMTIFTNLDTTRYKYKITTAGYGITIVMLTDIEDEEQTLTAFCTAQDTALTMIWQHKSHPTDILDYLVIFPDEVCDLITGRSLMDVSGYGDYIDSYHILKGATRKPDNTGYYIWLDGEEVGYEILFSIQEELKKEGKWNNIMYNKIESFPEMHFAQRASFPGETDMDRYYWNAKVHIQEYDKTMPFPVYTHYSLFPYFYYKCTGKYVLTLVISKYSKNKVIVCGYSKKGNRTFRKYALKDIYNTLQRIYDDFGKDSFVFLPANDKFVLDTWFSLLTTMGKDSYIEGNREDKVRMIDEIC